MLKQGGGGAVVNTSSGAGLAGIRGMPAYVAAKHGVAGLTRAAALEYGRQGIRVNAVCPGPIRTPMMARGLKRRPDLEERYARSEPLKRLGEPEEIGEAVAWLCSERGFLRNRTPDAGGWRLHGAVKPCTARRIDCLMEPIPEWELNWRESVSKPNVPSYSSRRRLASSGNA